MVVVDKTLVLLYGSVVLANHRVYALYGPLYARIEIVFDVIVPTPSKAPLLQLTAYHAPLMRVLPEEGEEHRVLLC